MRSIIWAEALWGKNAKLIYLLLAAVFLLFGMLGSREMWTQEHRWADIVTSMFYYHDFLHPRLNGQEYYDKPLLSYWLIAGLSAVIGQLTLFTLRFPSALAGLLAIWAIYRIGFHLKDKRLGLLAGWLMLTTYYFIFWARISSADILNLAGSIFAVAWYFEKRNHTRLLDYIIFFLILAGTALCKGLVGPIVAVLAILPDIFLQNSWKKHFNSRLFIGMIPAVLVYILPFWASAHFGNDTYQQNGLYEVYRENVLRYFHPFDHKGPIYTYFIYLPVYLLPWAFFFIPALFCLRSRWHEMSANTRWAVWATALLFLFFTLSGSRRSYYILPIVPYAILITADWILSGADALKKRYIWAGRAAVSSYVLFTLMFILLLPFYYSKGGVGTFHTLLQEEANKIKPWSQWHIALLDAESKISFYLKLPPDIKNQDTTVPREKMNREYMSQDWPILKSKPVDTIIISRKLYESSLREILKGYRVVLSEPTYLEGLLSVPDPNLPVAFIPIKN